jgi:hypothetical protein
MGSALQGYINAGVLGTDHTNHIPEMSMILPQLYPALVA